MASMAQEHTLESMAPDLVMATFLPSDTSYRSIIQKRDSCYALMRVNKKFYHLLKDTYKEMRTLVVKNNAYDSNSGHTPLIKAILDHRLQDIEYLLAHGANPNKASFYKEQAPLFTDFYSNSMFHLMGRDFYPSMPMHTPVISDKTPLRHAVLKSDYDTCKKLIEHGAFKKAIYKDMTNDQRIWKLLA
jgi:ankyrin repeat protein